MADILIESRLSTPHKRDYDGNVLTYTPDTFNTMGEPDSTNTISRQPSPVPSDATSELTDLTSTGLATPARAGNGVDGEVACAGSQAAAAVKKRKLTFAEREVEKAVKQREKEERARQKSDEKRQKDEEKRKKEEEKEATRRARELEKAEKRKVRDAEKLEKEAEKAKKEAEKREKEAEKEKKLKSQLRIGAFFGRPQLQSTPPGSPDNVSSRSSSRRSSILAEDSVEAAVQLLDAKPANPEFDKYIIPYFIHENTEVAPNNRFANVSKSRLLDSSNPIYDSKCDSFDIEELRNKFGPPRKRMRIGPAVKERVEQMQPSTSKALEGNKEHLVFGDVSYKILSFREDIRPPYIGTYTKITIPRIALKLSRRPTYRGRKDTNYDYDSEAEWEEPAADDEELLDDEMSESEDGEDEMQDFLDDENDHSKKRLFAGEMEPISSGLCFQGEDFNSNGHKMEDYRMDVLHDSVTFPIDPFSTSHWTDPGKSVITETGFEPRVRTDIQMKMESTSSNMPPPRAPLTSVNPPNSLLGLQSSGLATTSVYNENVSASIAKQRGRPTNPNKELKMIPAEFMNAFKQAIEGSDMTKAGLIEVLKKQFPKCSKDAIKDTLGLVAMRVGKKEAEKKWALVSSNDNLSR